MRVVVIGVGALGSHVVQLVRNLDIKLVLVDFDRVEQRNVQSQFHSRPSVGKSKVEGLRNMIQLLFDLRVETNPRKVTSLNVEAILGKADLVLDCLDNAESRRLVQAFVRDKGIPCLHGALAPDGMFGQVLWDEDFMIDEEDVEGQATCEGGEFLPFIGVVSSLMALAVQRFVDDDRRVGYNASPGGVAIV